MRGIKPLSALSSVVLPAPLGAEHHGQAGLDIEFHIAQHEKGAVPGREAVHLEAGARAAAEFERGLAVPHHAVAPSCSDSFISSPR